MLAQCKIIGIPQLTRLMIVNSGIHVFRIPNCPLRFWNTDNNLESKDLGEPESTRWYKIQGVKWGIQDCLCMKLHDLMLCQTILQEFSRFLQIKFKFMLQVSSMLFLNVLIIHFTRTRPRVEVGKRADCCVRTRLEETMCLLKGKRSRTS